MWRKIITLTVLTLLPALLLAAGPKRALEIIVPTLDGSESVNAAAVFPPYPAPPVDEVDIIGDTVIVGDTWYENQHNGSCGRMIEISDDGVIHLGWMKGMDSASSVRHVFYNYNSAGVWGFPGSGIQINSTPRAGFITLDADFGGIAFPAFHETSNDPNNYAHTAVGADFSPHTGAFLTTEPEWLSPGGTALQIIWPHAQFDHNQTMHIISAEQTTAGNIPKRQFYTPGTYVPPNMTYPSSPDSSFRIIDWTMTLAYDVATSEVSNRVAFGWTRCKTAGFPNGTFGQWDNDIYLLIDEDGQDLHFEDAFNLTQFTPPDLITYPFDSVMASMDTLRAYTDLSLFIDHNNYAHAVFTTRGYYAAFAQPYSWYNASTIWHWSEQFPGEFQTVANFYDEGDTVYCGAFGLKAQRPELGEDANGVLYCMYQVYDTDLRHLSAFIHPNGTGTGMPSGEIYVCKSMDGGLSWTEGINVTNTLTPQNAPAGQCLSELTPSLAKKVDDYMHIIYVLDLDAGNVVQTPAEGLATDNPVVYHRVPVSEIPSSPFVPQWPEPGSAPFHVEHGPPVGIPGASRYEMPRTFGLNQNYPNPFNPTTSVTFSLDQVSDVSLDVYNLKGEVVARMASGTFGTGEHTAHFNASGLASGVYIYKLQAGNRSLERKMLLLK